MQRGMSYVDAMVVELGRQGVIASTNEYSVGNGWLALRQEIDTGRPTIIRTAHGAVTSTGHYIVAVGYRETDSDRQIIGYDPFGRWKGTCCVDHYDLNSREQESHIGQWVFYDFDSAFGNSNWLIRAKR